MDSPLLQHPLLGSFTPLVTPFTKGAVDEERFRGLVELQIRGGSHGVVVTGTSGEPSTLTIEERARLYACAVSCAAGRLPVIAATGSQSLAETLALGASAEVAGASALLVVTPYYIRPSQAGLEEYFVEVARNANLPVLVYHIPQRAAVSIEVETLRRIRDRAPNVVGVKHSSTDVGFITEVRHVLGSEFRIFGGLEELSWPMLAAGASGLVSAVGNLLPGRVAALCEAAARRDMAAGLAIHDELFAVNRAVFFDTNPIPMKWLMTNLGILAANEHRLPMLPASAAVVERLRPIAAAVRTMLDHPERPPARDPSAVTVSTAARSPHSIRAPIRALDESELTAELRAALAPRIERLGYLGEFFRVAGRQPRALLAFMELTDALKSALPDRLTEVVALTIAARLGNRYERHQHERLCLALGYDVDWIRAVLALSPETHDGGLTPEEAATQQLALHLMTSPGADGGPALAAVVELCGQDRAVALILLVGRYVAHAMVVGATKLEPPVDSVIDPGAASDG